jgi:hypothetical protein
MIPAERPPAPTDSCRSPVARKIVLLDRAVKIIPDVKSNNIARI